MVGDAQEMRGRGVRRHGGSAQMGTQEGGGKGVGKVHEDRERRVGREPTDAFHIWDVQKVSILTEKPCHRGRGRAPGKTSKGLPKTEGRRGHPRGRTYERAVSDNDSDTRTCHITIIAIDV